MSLLTFAYTYCSADQTVQPLLAQAIAIGFTGLKLTKMYEDMTQSLDTMDPSDVYPSYSNQEW